MKMFDKEVKRTEDSHRDIMGTIEWAKSLNLDKLKYADISFYEYRVTISIPPGSFGAFRRTLGTEWKRESKFSNAQGSIFILYNHKKNHSKGLTIVIDALLRKETCQRVQIGIEEVPQYKIICT